MKNDAPSTFESIVYSWAFRWYWVFALGLFGGCLLYGRVITSNGVPHWLALPVAYMFVGLLLWAFIRFLGYEERRTRLWKIYGSAALELSGAEADEYCLYRMHEIRRLLEIRVRNLFTRLPFTNGYLFRLDKKDCGCVKIQVNVVPFRPFSFDDSLCRWHWQPGTLKQRNAAGWSHE